MLEKERAFLTRTAYLAVWAALLWLVARYLLVWLLPFLLALGLAALLEPLLRFCRRRLRLRRGFTAAVVTLVLLGGLGALTALLLLALLRQAEELLARLPTLLSGLPGLTGALRARLDAFCTACPEELRRWVSAAPSLLAEQTALLTEHLSQCCLTAAGACASALPGVLLFCGTTALALFFTTADYPGLTDFLRRQLPPRRLRQLRTLRRELLATLGKWGRAQALLLLTTFCQLLAGLLLLGQRYALLLSALIALIDALPVFGTGTVLLPWAAACLLLGRSGQALALLALYGLIAAVRSVLEPRLMAAQAGLPPLAALAAMYVGFRALGVAGMLLLPVALLLIKQLHDGGYLHLWK